MEIEQYIIEQLKTEINKLIKRKAREMVYQDHLQHRVIKILDKNNITNEISRRDLTVILKNLPSNNETKHNIAREYLNNKYN